MEKFPFSPALESAEREAEDLLLRGSGPLHPGIGVKQATAIVTTHFPTEHSPCHRKGFESDQSLAGLVSL